VFGGQFSLRIRGRTGLGIIRSLIMKKLTIQAMLQLAERHGGECLSDVYVNSKSKLLWQCAKGHQWKAAPYKIQYGSWCPKCSGNVKLTIEDMHRLAETRGGRCLSDVYVNTHTLLQWECKEGHRWQNTHANVGRGQWCPHCAGLAELTIQEMRSLAESRGGRCLSDVYVNTHTPLLWECRARHRWEAQPSSVKGSSWCPVCAGHTSPSMNDINRLANERGGKCLSRDYKDSQSPLEWECIEGHQWKATWNNIRRGKWCPTCSAGLGERICREFFSQLFRCPFPKSRPEWLVNKAGNRMELDGYSATLRIAFEHQGKQHYDTDSHFFGIEKDLSRRQEDDTLKSDLCTQKGIALVAVPQIPDLLPLDQVRAFIKEALAANGIPLPQDFITRDVDLNRAYRTPGSRELLDHLRAIATEHGGKCLSTSYVNSITKLKWECAKGHQWTATPNGVQQGAWCPECGAAKRGHAQRLGLPEMQAIAASRGGRCLSDEYVNSKTHLLWRCKEGHEWKASPDNIKRGKWCPICGYRRGWERRRSR